MDEVIERRFHPEELAPSKDPFRSGKNVLSCKLKFMQYLALAVQEKSQIIPKVFTHIYVT